MSVLTNVCVIVFRTEYKLSRFVFHYIALFIYKMRKSITSSSSCYKIMMNDSVRIFISLDNRTVLQKPKVFYYVQYVKPLILNDKE